MFESEKQEAKCKISTAIDIEQVKTSDDQSISRCAERAPEMRNFRVEGTKGEMYMRYTAAAGIDGTNILEDESNKESRGKMITNGNFYDDYGLFAYEYPSTQIWSSVSATATPTIVNEQVNPCSNEGGQLMTVEELRAQFPELVAQSEAEAVAAGNDEAISNAVQTERSRLQAIDEIAGLFDSALVDEAKYGETACDAAELSLRAARNAAHNGRTFLANLEADSEESGADDVNPAPAPEEEDEEPKTEEEKMAKARADVKKALGKN